LKDELKQTRMQRDLYKKKFEEQITVQDQSEIMNLLRHSVERLVFEINIK
jgi:hypothetical protein